MLGAYLGWRLGTLAGRGTLRTAGAVVMGGLASAALWGAVCHAWFPAKIATPAGFLVWMLVAFSILVVAARLLDLGLSIVAPRLAPTLRRTVVLIYGIVFAGVVLLVNESFTTIVRFYAPTLVLILMAALL